MFIQSILCVFVHAELELYEDRVWETKPPAPLVVCFATNKGDAQEYATCLDLYMKGLLVTTRQPLGTVTCAWLPGTGGFFHGENNKISFISADSLEKLQSIYVATLEYFAAKYQEICTVRQTPTALTTSQLITITSSLAPIVDVQAFVNNPVLAGDPNCLYQIYFAVRVLERVTQAIPEGTDEIRRIFAQDEQSTVSRITALINIATCFLETKRLVGTPARSEPGQWAKDTADIFPNDVYKEWAQLMLSRNGVNVVPTGFNRIVEVVELKAKKRMIQATQMYHALNNRGLIQKLFFPSI